MKLDFVLKPFDTAINITRFAYIHYFEFMNQKHFIPNYHNFCELVYVDKGLVEIASDSYEGILRNNEMIIHAPNETHSMTCDFKTPPEVIVIGFECTGEALELISSRPITLSPEQRKILAQILNDGMSVYAPPFNVPYITNMQKRPNLPLGADQLLKLHLEEFLISVISSDYYENSTTSVPSGSNNIEIIYQYINENFTQKISLDNLCFLFGTNKTTLCRDFKNAYNMTLLEYINYLKIGLAKKLLKKGDISVTDIAEQCGFNSVHYFCRFFAKQTGQSPKKYLSSVNKK